jgi:Tol biopolymer transport system component
VRRKNDVLIPEAATSKESALVDTGDSAQAVFSPDGSHLLFISGDRKTHAHYQVYEKDLRTGDETRITFQNGDTYFPRYHPTEPWIIYSSSTDELKENPPLLQAPKEQQKIPESFQMPLEVYLHSLKDYQIVRVTERMGFDGEASFTPDGGSLTWTRVKGPRTEILTMKRNSKVPTPLSGLGFNPSQYTISKDNKWRAWIDSDETFAVPKLKIRTGKKAPIELNADTVVPKTDLVFSPDSKYLLWSQFNPTTSTYQLWASELATGCTHRLTENVEGQGDRRYPALSPDMKVLAFTSRDKKRSRIMQVSWTAPSATCAAKP